MTTRNYTFMIAERRRRGGKGEEGRSVRQAQDNTDERG
jgi:hypothetical protein